MIVITRVEQILKRYPVVASAVYAALVLVFVVTALGTVSDLMERRDAVAAGWETLAQLQSRGAAQPPVAASDVSVPAGSSFLEGSTLSVAGAALLQRVASAVTKVRGNTLSTQIDLQGAPSKPGFTTVTTSFEIQQSSLQPLLYDLEAGMPFLFVDQLVVQAPSGTPAGDDAKLRVLMSISAQWQGGK